MDKKELLKKMKELDERIFDLYPEFGARCIVIGGGALILKDLIPRMTTDIDVINAKEEMLNLFPIFGFSNKATVYEMNLPYNYEDRLEKIHIETKSLEYFTPSTEDLIVTKFYASREKDIEDIHNIKKSGKYSTERLKKVVEEARMTSMNDFKYREMVSLYHRYFNEEENDESSNI